MQLLYNQKDMQSQQRPMAIYFQSVKIGKLNKMEDPEDCIRVVICGVPLLRWQAW